MKEYASDLIRNVAIVSHDGAGKTALVEALLLACGAVDAVGKGQDNKHIMDFEPEEIKRNVTIQLGIAPCEWKGHKVNFIDTPGYSEFHGEVRAALRASDGMLMVLSATSGVEIDTVRAWDYGVELQMPRMAFINKMDVEGADFFGTLEKMHELFGKAIMPLQIPIGEGPDFKGVVDVAKRTAYVYENGKMTEVPVPEELSAKVEEIRELTVEAAAEGNDELLEKYLDGHELTLEEIRQGLREGMLTGRVCAVMCGSAIHNIGMDQVLDRMIRYMPDAAKRVMTAKDADTGEQKIVHVDKPFTGFVFKTVLDPFAGKQSFIRIFSGELKEGDKLYNISQDVEEKWGKMYTLIGKQQVPISEAGAGDIVVIPKLPNAKTGDTFGTAEFKVTYDPIRFPQPLHTVAMVAEKKGEEEKLASALARIAEEDPTCVVTKDVEGRQMQVRCMGEVHLEHILTKMERKYGAKAKLEKLYIPYRETVRGTIEVEGKHKKQSGGHGQYGHVKIKIEPLYDGEFEFVDEIFGGAVPRQYIPAVEKGVRETLEHGLIAGYPMIGVKVTLLDGSYHSVDSSELAFKVAAAQALKKGVPEAKPILLEPIYDVNIFVPDAFTGDIMGDLTSRRGRVLGMEQAERAGVTVIKAQVPFEEMLDYVTVLRSMTQGQGVFNMEFSSYEEVPHKKAEAIIAAYVDEDAE
ncbi:elongation factor G [uncultured Veillonella sp.]|uniref:elongation factor G n=1 Tax=uncultured Veillonella sp. TaxID=159268 RepID=UPI002609579C|nr:elongation factor G [uncultured Veillonella sp.]